MKEFFSKLNLEHLLPIMKRELISMDILMNMSHDDLKSIGITFGEWYRILHKVKEQEPTAVPVAHIAVPLPEISN